MQPPDAELLAVQRLIHLEAHYLDTHRWDEWLDLYTNDAVYWVPSWRSEGETVSDPEVSLNLIYLTGKEAIADRIFRIRTQDSLATVPIDRTAHVVGTTVLHEASTESLRASAGWVVHSYGHGGIFTRGGHYEYDLARTGGALQIARKKIILIDDRLEGPIDVYHL